MGMLSAIDHRGHKQTYKDLKRRLNPDYCVFGGPFFFGTGSCTFASTAVLGFS